MTTVPQKYMLSEVNKINSDFQIQDNLTTLCTSGAPDSDVDKETLSENEVTASKPDTPVSCTDSEETEDIAGNNDVQEKLSTTVTDYKYYDIKTIPGFFRIIFRLLFSLWFDLFFAILNMLNSDVNNIIDTCSAYLGISQRINRKLLKQLLVLAVFIFAFVQSRNDGLYQNFETHRLFSRHSLVTDFFHGELSLLNQQLMESDMTIVMYYAPWDRQSQKFVSHFLKAAQYHHEQVSFAAINCWLPKSECRQHYKLHYYPIVVLHVNIATLEHSLTVPYNGPLSAHHLIRFISQALRPFSYISSHSQLLSTQLEYQVIALGHYEVGNFNKDFVSFYCAAISKLQFEHMSDVKYALITNPALARKVSFTHRPGLHLITWNTTLVFPYSVEKNLKNLTTFVDLHLSEVVRWLHISGRKSLALNKVFQEGPFMVVFSPDNPYHSSNDPVQVIRSVALEYFNCLGSPLQIWLADHLHRKTREQLRKSDKICRNYLKSHLDNGVNLMKSLRHNEKLPRNEDCGIEDLLDTCEGVDPSPVSYITWSHVWSSFSGSDPLLSGGQCLRSRLGSSSPSSCKTNKNESSSKMSEAPNQQWMKHSEEQDPPETEHPVRDDRVSQLSDWASEEHCKKLVLGALVSPPPIVKEERGERISVKGLGCHTNRTLRFVAVDSLLHSDFAQHLGLDLSDRTPKLSGSVIIDPVMEERYILAQPLSRNSLATFIHNFTNNLLNRAKRYSEPTKTKMENVDGEVCMMELNSNNYVDVISKPRQAVVVLHYSHHCGACSVIGNVLLTCLHLTAGVSNLTWARVDVSKNTLPWHLTFETVPTIVFYPHDKQSNSRIFDSRLPVTVKNVIAFIVSGLKAPERNSLALKLCDSKCRKTTLSQSLLMKLKLHFSISVISSRLKRFTSLTSRLKQELHLNSESQNLHSKFTLYSEHMLNLNRKLSTLKSKLSHLNQVISVLPKHVPSQSHRRETKIMMERVKNGL